MTEGLIVIAGSVSDIALFVIASLPLGRLAISVFTRDGKLEIPLLYRNKKLDIRFCFSKITIKIKWFPTNYENLSS
jgi:hypothetical protein